MNGKEVLFIFKTELSKYAPDQLRNIPTEGVWSIGQMYDHIILGTHEYLNNVKICAASPEAQSLGKTPKGEQLFKDGGFPPVKIRLPDEMNTPPTIQTVRKNWRKEWKKSLRGWNTGSRNWLQLIRIKKLNMVDSAG